MVFFEVGVVCGVEVVVVVIVVFIKEVLKKVMGFLDEVFGRFSVVRVGMIEVRGGLRS